MMISIYLMVAVTVTVAMGDAFLAVHYESGWKYYTVEIKYIPNTQPDHVNNILMGSLFLHDIVLPH